LALFFIALLCHHGTYGNGLLGLGNLLNGGDSHEGGEGGLLDKLLDAILGGVLKTVKGGLGLLNLIKQLVKQLTSGGGHGQPGCGILASLIGGCSGQAPCCGCCNQTNVGVNNVCVTIGLLDFLVGTAECPSGSILACTGEICKPGQTCNVVNAANLACVNV
jgi:hypothetical protein